MEMKVILSAPPTMLSGASRHERPIAHMAYQIGQEFRLFRSSIPLGLRGGYMMLGEDSEASLNGNPETLAAEIMRECIHRGFAGVIFALRRTSPSLHSLAAVLSGRLKLSGGELYLPETYAHDSDWAKVLISTAISGGSLAGRLGEMIEHYGAERICLDIERIRHDFCLPTDSGRGEALSAKALAALMEAHGAESYFSQDLCAYYFTYQDEQGSHFVLYDDAGSVRKKLFLAQKLGISSALLFYPETFDILPAALL